MDVPTGLDRLQPTGAATEPSASTPDSAHLRELAAQFEAMLLGQMLREMQSSMFGEDQEKDSMGFGTGPLVEALFSEMSLALSRAGGLGIGDALMEPLSRQASEAVTGGMGMLTSPALMPSSLAVSGRDVDMSWTPATPSALEALRGRVTSAYGWREDPIDSSLKFHKGTDIALPEGHDVPAARAGRVTFAGELPGYGLTVTVDHGDQVSTRYAHLSEIAVEPGEMVAAGQTIAQSGATGRVTGPHLHFEVLESGRSVDPSVMIGQMTEGWRR
jgi:murein DD-endopeptidase MepM/ murein hydrolase activator NlpD